MSDPGADDELGARLHDDRAAPSLQLSSDLRRRVIAGAERVSSRPPDLWRRVALLSALGVLLLAVAAALA
jgi:hypothetical protein